MSEAVVNTERKRRTRRIRHKGRFSQIWIYLGKQIRFFINQSDWKVLPMAAIIAGLVGMVIRKRLFINMEGALIGAFALTCVAIWNGCFNSIQSVCRERAIIKREHRSGMHISSYVAAHMLYQLALCLIQTGISVYILKTVGVQFPAKGFMTRWMLLDIGISMFLISYAADMMSLFISSLSRTTTGAMTVMPFVLIFQLVFSGGIIPLPEWSKPLSNYTISNYGIRAIASQSGYNELPMVTGWNTLNGLRHYEVGGTYTVGQVLDLLDDEALDQYRDKVLVKSYTVGDVADMLTRLDEALNLREMKVAQPITIKQIIQFIMNNDALKKFRESSLFPGVDDDSLTVGYLLNLLLTEESTQELMNMEIGTTISVGQVLDAIHAEELVDSTREEVLNQPLTVGRVLDFVKNSEVIQAQRDRSFTVKLTVGELIDMIGEERVKNLVQEKTAEAAQKQEYEMTPENITGNWMMLCLFIFVFALLSTITLEMIDKDKR